MNKLFNLVFFVTSFYIFSTCSSNSVNPNDNLSYIFPMPPDNEHKVSIEQGIWGNVWFWEGNLMPPLDPRLGGKIYPVTRMVYIFELTHKSELETDSLYPYLIKQIMSQLITVTISDDEGFFQAFLMPGKYSVFVKENLGYFGNRDDGKGYVMGVEIEANKVKKKQIDITYKASF